MRHKTYQQRRQIISKTSGHEKPTKNAQNNLNNQINQQNFLQNEPIIKQYYSPSYKQPQQLKPTAQVQQFKNIKTLIRINSDSEAAQMISPIIETNTERTKITYHSFKKFKSYTFNFDKIVYSSDKASKKGFQFLELKGNSDEEPQHSCLLVCGGAQSGIQQTCQGTLTSEGLFYSIIHKYLDQSKRQQTNQLTEDSVKYSLECIIVDQDTISDAPTGNHVQIRENHTKQYEITNTHVRYVSSAYEAYTFLKQCYFAKKKSYNPDSIFIAIFTVQKALQPNKIVKQKSLFIQWQMNNKSGKNFTENLQVSNHSLLILNQCILELYKMKQKGKSLENIRPPFRDSKITRLLKPYLLYNCNFSVVGCISTNQEFQESSFQTLMLVKHLSKLQFRLPYNMASRNILHSPGKKSECLEDAQISKSPESQSKSKLQRLLKDSEQKSIDKWIEVISQKEQKAKQQIDMLNNKIQIHKMNVVNSQIFGVQSQENQDENEQNKITDRNLHQLQLQQLEKMECQFAKIKNYLGQIQNDKIKRLQALNMKEKVSAMKKYYTLELQHEEKEADRYLMLKQVKKNQLKEKIEALKHYLQSGKKNRKVQYDLGLGLAYNSEKNADKKLSLKIPKNPPASTNLEPINLSRNLNVNSNSKGRNKNLSQKLKTQTKGQPQYVQKQKYKKPSINKSYTDDRDKFHQMYNKGHTIKLAKSLQRRRQFLKNKVKEGRVEQKNFLDIHANRYKNYQGYKEKSENSSDRKK